MTIAEEVINALSKRLKELSADATPEEIAYLAKTLESVAGKSTVLDIVNMTDEKLEALLSAATKHLSDLNTNKESSLSAITETKEKSLEAIDTLKTSALSNLKTSADSHMSLLDTRKNEHIAGIESTGKKQLSTLKGLVSDFEAAFDPRVLKEVLSNRDLEAWLSDIDNQEKFNKMLSNPSSVLTIIGHPEGLTAIAGSSLAMEALVKSDVTLNAITNFTTTMNVIASSSVARDIVRNSTTAMSIVNSNSMAIAKLASGLAGLATTSYADMNAIANSSVAMNAIVGSAVALKAIVQSELACRAIETNIQSHRSTVVNTLNASPSLFTKQSGIKIGNGNATVEHDTNSSTIYIPTSCHDDNDTDFYVNSLLTGSRLASISRHSGDVAVTSGIALRGVQVHGSGGSVGNVTFDIYTAV